MATGGQFCLRWNNHQPNMVSVFTSLLQNDQLVDVTLLAENNEIHAHKMVLAACSPYFQSLFIRNPCKHPVIILADVKFIYLKNLVEFMYNGEINIFQDHLPELLRVAELLKVKGLEEIPSFDFSNEMEQQQQQQHQQQHQHQQQQHHQHQQQQQRNETNDSDENDELNVAEYLHATDGDPCAPNGIGDIVEINETHDMKPNIDTIDTHPQDGVDTMSVSASTSNGSFRRLRSTSAASQPTAAALVEMPVIDHPNGKKFPYYTTAASETTTTNTILDAKTIECVASSLAAAGTVDVKPNIVHLQDTASGHRWSTQHAPVQSTSIVADGANGSGNSSGSSGSGGSGSNCVNAKTQKCNAAGGKRKLIRQNENFIRALEAVRFDGIGFCKAARMHGVNNRTLWLEYQKLGYPTKKPRKKQ